MVLRKKLNARRLCDDIFGNIPKYVKSNGCTCGLEIIQEKTIIIFFGSLPLPW
jgi:hypothetical protein